MTTAAGQQRAPEDAATFRHRLLDGLAASIEADGYRATTVADIVRRARTSRRTVYEHFAGKEDCFVALLTDANARTIRQIYAAVDPATPWRTQVRRAVEAWVASSEAAPALTLAWIRELPSLGAAARALQRDVTESFITVIQTLCDTEEWRAAGLGPVPRQVALMLIGALRELIATTVEDGGRAADITEVAVRGSIALLGPA